jgi:predicted alpha-1,6-mannanase (GH76 family)
LDPTTGGILWVEDGDTFNACSTGAGALLHTELGGNIDASLDFLSSLRNADGLVRDHLRADGSIEASIYSYNQGLLMAAALRAGDRRLAEQACEAGDAYFTVDRLWEQAVCFNAIYAKARLRIGDSAQIRDYADRLEVEGRDEHGWFTAAGRYDEGSVLDTAGALQIFTLLRFGHLIQRVV